MRSINKVIIIGNLTRDPEMRQTPNGQNVTTFGVATNRDWMTKDGEKKSSAEFHECVAWSRLAEICNQYLNKGQLVYIEGYLKTRSWDSPEGVKKFKTEIVVKDMIRLEKKSSGDAGDDNDYFPTDDAMEPDDFDSSDDNQETNSSQESAGDDNAATEEPAASSSNNEDENPIDKDLGL